MPLDIFKQIQHNGNNTDRNKTEDITYISVHG